MDVRIKKSVIILLVMLMSSVILFTACSFSNADPSGTGVEQQVPDGVGPIENDPAEEGEGEEGLPTPNL